MSRIQLWKVRGLPGYHIHKIDEETGCYLSGNENTLLFQTDWEFPMLASNFGWSIRESQVGQAGYYGTVCDHSGTDGTVKCETCGLTPSTFIREATEYLDAHLGQIADDPGYFS